MHREALKRPCYSDRRESDSQLSAKKTSSAPRESRYIIFNDLNRSVQRIRIAVLTMPHRHAHNESPRMSLTYRGYLHAAAIYLARPRKVNLRIAVGRDVVGKLWACTREGVRRSSVIHSRGENQSSLRANVFDSRVYNARGSSFRSDSLTIID